MPIIVALGKFDAMHIGHRSLAITVCSSQPRPAAAMLTADVLLACLQAAAGGAQPVLLSFSGLAEVLGQPVRLPLVAFPDRPRVLASWTPHCQGRWVTGLHACTDVAIGLRAGQGPANRPAQAAGWAGRRPDQPSQEACRAAGCPF